MTTTTSSYLTISKNMASAEANVAKDPIVKAATAYYAANIGKVKTLKDFVGNYRLMSYAMTAFGLGDQVNAKAMISKVLSGGVSNAKSLANTLNDPRWKAFAKTFDFSGAAPPALATSASIKAVTQKYLDQQIESKQGQQNPGVQLALYFKRVAPGVTSAYGILGDKNLLTVAQTIFGLSPYSSQANIDVQAAILAKLMPIGDLSNPAKLEKLTERFTAMYDASGAGAASAGASSSGTSVLFGSNLTGAGLSVDLLAQIQNFKIGGS